MICSPEDTLSCRGNKIPTPLFLEGSRHLKLIQAIPVNYGAEWNGRPFFRSGNRAYGRSWKLRDLKTPAQISDPGSFCDRSVSNGVVCGFLSLKSPGRGRDYCLLIPFQSRVSCRGDQLLFEIFRRGTRSVETDPGESHTSGTRMHRSDVFEIAD